ncbi:MAG: HD-GYP domain-containing protein, partial [Acetivibrionales bacterium]|jgi:HD-GYP domain-containing protein (c-di-GMP phosphodiesterase class II)
MRLVGLDQINGTEVLGKPIYDIDGRRLLNSGVSLRPAIIQKLYEKGISSIYIDDDISEGIEVNSLLREETKNHAKLIVREEMHRLSHKSTLDYSRLAGVVDSILEEMLSRKIEMINVKDVRMQDEQTFAHCVNVCVMSIALSARLSLTVQKVKSIALGALLHDIGKALLPPSLLNKTDALTESEMTEMKKHPIIGYNLLKDNADTPATTKVAVLMHHEHVNGTGYPMNLTSDKIHYSARILTVCDEFDTAINDKKNENVLRTTDAVEYLIGASGYIFDKSIAEEFIKMIPIYNEGSIVLLSNGIIAIVVKNNPVNLTRPIVRAFYNPKTKTKYSKVHIIDLRTELSIKILRELKVNVNEMIDS